MIGEVDVRRRALFRRPPLSPRSPRRGGAAPPSPLHSPRGAAPTLRPSLRERHDFVVALLPDGSLLVWLLLGLSASPRTAPKVMLWANLPSVLPRVDRFLGAASFCHFNVSMAAASEAGDATGAEPSPRDEERLPSAVSLLQHTAEPDCPVRLCCVDVERGVAGERAHHVPLRGHSADSLVTGLVSHPSSDLVASLDSHGAVLLWRPAAPAVVGAAPSDVIDTDGEGGSAACPPHRGGSRGDPTHLACTARLPLDESDESEKSGTVFDCVTWLPTRTLSLLALGKTGARLFAQAASSLQWERRAVAREECDAGWCCAHAFPPGSRAKDNAASAGDGPASAYAFALSNKSSRLHVRLRAPWSRCSAKLTHGSLPFTPQVWATDGTATLCSLGEACIELPGSAAAATCAAPLPCWAASRHRAAPSEKSEKSAGGLELGFLLCGYADGAVALWSARALTSLTSPTSPTSPTSLKAAGLALRLCTRTRAAGGGPTAGSADLADLADLRVVSLSTLAAGAECPPRAAAVLRRAPAGVAAGEVGEVAAAAHVVRVFEFEASEAPQVALELPLGCKGTPACAMLAVSSGAVVLAVAAGGAVELYALLGGARRAVAHTSSGRGCPLWAPLASVALPSGLSCAAMTWTAGGGLLLGTGPVIRVETRLLGECDALTPAYAPQWHPTALFQTMLVAPDRGNRLIEHLAARQRPLSRRGPARWTDDGGRFSAGSRLARVAGILAAAAAGARRRHPLPLLPCPLLPLPLRRLLLRHGRRRARRRHRRPFRPRRPRRAGRPLRTHATAAGRVAH